MTTFKPGDRVRHKDGWEGTVVKKSRVTTGRVSVIKDEAASSWYESPTDNLTLLPDQPTEEGYEERIELSERGLFWDDEKYSAGQVVPYGRYSKARGGAPLRKIKAVILETHQHEIEEWWEPVTWSVGRLPQGLCDSHVVRGQKSLHFEQESCINWKPLGLLHRRCKTCGEEVG